MQVEGEQNLDECDVKYSGPSTQQLQRTEGNNSVPHGCRERVQNQRLAGKSRKAQAEKECEEWETSVKRRQQTYFQNLGDGFRAYRKRLPTICKLLKKGVCKCYEGDNDGFLINNSEIIWLKCNIAFAFLPKIEKFSMVSL